MYVPTEACFVERGYVSLEPRLGEAGTLIHGLATVSSGSSLPSKQRQ